jgi:hypothetical protein
MSNYEHFICEFITQSLHYFITQCVKKNIVVCLTKEQGHKAWWWSQNVKFVEYRNTFTISAIDYQLIN